MKKPFKVPEKLAEQHDALTMYLEALLNEACAGQSDSSDFTTAVEEQSNQLQENTQQRTTHSAATTVTANVDDIGVSNLTAPGIQSSIEENDATAAGHGLQHKISSPPIWAVPGVQVLTFTISNLQMAAPLDQLNGIIPFPQRITVLPGQSSWSVGLMRNREQNVQVIDLAPFIEPASDTAAINKTSSENANYILLLEGGRKGIVCTTISDVLTLEPQDVHWQVSKHVEFIAGTVIDKMYSVLDVECLITHLSQDSTAL